MPVTIGVEKARPGERFLGGRGALICGPSAPRPMESGTKPSTEPSPDPGTRRPEEFVKSMRETLGREAKAELD